MQLLRMAGGRLADLLFPPVCPGCRTALGTAGALCARCWSGLAFIERPYCERLGLPLARDEGPGALSPLAIAAPPRFDRMRAAVVYGELPARLAASLKYGDRLDLAPLLAGWMTRAGAELLAEADLVVPVPLHRIRLFRRRFNQSAELAKLIARQAGRPYAPTALARVRRTRRQVGLGARERRRNVAGAFAVPAGRRGEIAGRRVLLVDDVFTTGATIASATRALRVAGAAAVDVLVFARVAASS